MDEKARMAIFPDGRMAPVDAARYLGYAPGTLANMRSHGTGPRFVKRGHRVWYWQSDLDTWLQAAPPCTSTAQYAQRRQGE